MKNLLKVLLVLAFSTSAFADMGTTKLPEPASITVETITIMDEATLNNWLKNLTVEQYNKLTPEVQTWMNELTAKQYNLLDPKVQALVQTPVSTN